MNYINFSNYYTKGEKLIKTGINPYKIIFIHEIFYIIIQFSKFSI